MKHTLFIFAILLSQTSFGQVPFIQWAKCFGGSSADFGMTILQTPDSGYVMAAKGGSTDGDISGSHGPEDYWVVKMTPTGSIAWQKCYGGTSADKIQSMQQTNDGGFVLIGSTYSNDGDVTGNHGLGDFWVVKISATGAVMWQKTLGGSNADFGHYISQTADSGYLVVGASKSSDGDVTINHGGFDVWVVRLSSTGSILWQKSYGGSGDDFGGAGLQTYDGGFIIAASTGSGDGDVTGSHGGDDCWLIKISDTGRIEWQKTYGGSGDDDVNDETSAAALQITRDSSFIFAGWSDSHDGDVTGNHGSFDFWVVKISDTGRIIWEKSLGGTNDDEATTIEQTSDGGYIAAGITASNDGDVSGSYGAEEYWVVKITDTGHLQWQKCLGGTGYSPADCANSIHQTMGGGYIITGYTNANNHDVSGNHGDYDAWVVKLNCLMPSAGPVTGASELCTGATITLSDTAAGGSWSTSNSHASVSAAGVVTGLSGGTSTITYVVANTCGADIATHVVTVDPAPVPVVTLSGTTLSTAPGFGSYQWFFNGSAIPGATNNTYNETASGNYSVVVTDGNGCTGTSTADTVHNVGIQMLSSSHEVLVFPNPAFNTIYISGIATPTVRLYDLHGQLVKDGKCNEINVSGLAAGIYYILVSDENGNILHGEKITKL